jgi:glycosyltransferase involved in cell wall biosynthesis
MTKKYYFLIGLENLSIEIKMERQKLMDIVLFGTGDRGKKLYKLFQHYEIEIRYWIDSDNTKWNTILEQKPIYAPSKIQNDNNVIIYISAVDEKREMYHILLQYGVQKYRIFSFYDAIVNCVYQCFRWNKPPIISNKTTILLDCFNGLILGGVEAWSISLIREFCKTDKEAYLFSPYRKYEFDDDIEKKILWVKSNPEKLFCWENIENILNVLQTKLPFVFISNFINDMFLAVCCLKKKYPTQIRFISVIHQGFPVAYREHAEFNQYIEKYIAVSKDIQEGLIKQGIKLQKVLHMTCPTSCIEPYLRKYSVNNDSPIRIGYAGRIESFQKRMDCLINLLNNLEQLHTNYKMEIVGTGSYSEQLAREIEEYGLSNRVTMLGRIDRLEVNRFWSKKDICINLSDFEGRSISIMEAMNNGVVPIVTATSGVKEDIIDNYNGYIVDIGDYTTMAKYIDFLANNRQLLIVYGDRAHNSIAKKSNMSIHMDFWNKIL